MKDLLYLITVILFFGCSNPKETWREVTKKYETINDFIDEFGSPVLVIDNENYKSGNDELQTFNDRFSTNMEVEEIVSMLNEWNKKAENTWNLINGDWDVEKVNVYKYLGSDEWLWLEKNYPKTSYKESSKNRIKRQNMINESFTEKLFWASFYVMKDNCIRNKGCNPRKNTSSKTGIELFEIPEKPKYKKEYKFFLEKSKYSDDFDDNELPPSTELKWFGIVWENWDGSLDTSPYSTEYEYINPYTICECMDNSDLTNNPLCQSMFRERYGTTVKNADNIQFETIKKDYDLNCN